MCVAGVFVIRNTYNAESQKVKNAIKSLDALVPMLASTLLLTNVESDSFDRYPK